MKYLFSALFALVLCACESVPYPTTAVVDQFSILRLHAPLQFDADQVAVYIQNGRVTHANLIDSYKPNCVLELRNRSNKPSRIEPDYFVVRTIRYSGFSAIQSPLQFTALHVHNTSDGPSHIEMETEMFLYSKKQQNVYKIGCRHWEQPNNARHLTIDEIRMALGGLISLEPARVQSPR